jgi:crotonobetainyl-CoA:carnitine CoA-transferase CaiB-like acyl-CoA transferase
MGFTYLTGEPDGKPVPCGIPIIDLKAGDEAFTQVVLAMLENNTNKEIHISMAQCAASWLMTALPQLNFVKSDSELFSRSGNEHRSFIPCNAYPTKDGYLYLAIGNDLQWHRFVSHKGFEKLFSEKRKTNEGRMNEKETIYKEIGELSKNYSTKEFFDLCISLNLSAAPVNTVKEVALLPFVDACMMKTTIPNGKEVKLSPPSYNTAFLEKNNFLLNCPPRLGEQNNKVYQQIGITEREIEKLITNKII